MGARVPKSTTKGGLRCTELLPVDAFHLKRVDCSLEAVSSSGEPQSVRVRLLLNDLKPEGVSIFCPRRVEPGAKARLTLSAPKVLVLPGQVEWLKECVQKRRVFSESVHCFRVGLHFEFATPEEAAQLKAYCEELAKVFPSRAA